VPVMMAAQKPVAPTPSITIETAGIVVRAECGSCEPMPSTGSHLRSYVARCKMGANTAYPRQIARIEERGRRRAGIAERAIIAHVCQ
jgi:hypothetical protein